MTKPAPAHADPNSGLLKNEPIVAGHAAAWLVLQLGVFLVSRYHIVTAGQWSAISIELTGIITAILLAASAWIMRRVVAPAWKLAEAEAAQLGVTLPDFSWLTAEPARSVPQSGQRPSDHGLIPAEPDPVAQLLAHAEATYPAPVLAPAVESVDQSPPAPDIAHL